MLLHLPEGRDARLAGQAMRQAITALPARLAGTITWDQGIEMTYLADFTIATGIPVYFCDPHSPCSADRTRIPTGCCASTCPKAPASVHSAGDLARIARSLNGRPRRALGFMKPPEGSPSFLHTPVERA